jgi:hypothetical protein
LPLGQHGITRVSQTQFYHLYGPLGVAGVLTMPSVGTSFCKNINRESQKNFYGFLITKIPSIYTLH